MTTYTNPRTRAVIENWPLGSNKRGDALFTVERVPGKGERAVRTTVGAPKKLTYAHKVRIVDGDDGRTYIAELSAYGFISVMRGDMKYQHESIFPENPAYPAVAAFFKDEDAP